MKKFFLSCLVMTNVIAHAQNIVSAEYFFDADPGVSNGTVISITPGASIQHSAVIPTASLTEGFHTLCIRTRDDAGVWGLYENRVVFIASALGPMGDIVSAEYFFDADPGPGNGTALGIGTGGSMVNFTAIIPSGSLPQGMHTLCIRVRNADGMWSLYESRIVYISSASAAMSDIVAAEYFVDADPGPGNGGPVNVGTAGSTVSFNAMLPSASLSPGVHTLGIRTRSTEGYWSLYELRPFYISNSAENMSDVVNTEFFIDSDPGVGNGSPLAINVSGQSVSENYMIPLPGGIGNGQHYLAIRTQDADGIWTLFEIDSFTVTGALPLQWISFEGERRNETVLLNWITVEEQHTDFFEVQRSANGVDFSTIGEVQALTEAYNEYEFTDSLPLKGVNFYRLRQADLDGSYSYSVIVRVLFSDNNSKLVLYPNPVTSELRIEMPGNASKVLIQLYDAGGRFIRSAMLRDRQNMLLGVGDLPAGVYRVVVSNGVSSVQGSFIKQ